MNPMGMNPMMMGPMGMQMPMMQMMRPGMKGMPMPGMMGMPKGGKGMAPRPQQQAMPMPQGKITPAALAAAPPGMQKQLLGEKLHAQISRQYPDLAGKITGMMLEMDNAELLLLLESPAQLQAKVEEARKVLGVAN